MKKIKLLGIIVFTIIITTTFITCGPPRLTGKVSIDGNPILGNTLTANTTSLGGSGIISYQWMRNGSTIDGMNGTTYTLKDSDRDATFSVIIIRSDNSGSVTSTSVTAYGYLIGEVGPGGGIIFYRNPNGFIMTDTGEKANFLEAAIVDIAGLAWASSSNIPPFAGGTGNWSNIEGIQNEIGKGRKNTALILATDANAPAALACKNYNGGNKNDWFLPSIDELKEMKKIRNTNDLLTSNYYWSSSQRGRDGADGLEGPTYWGNVNTRKDLKNHVRAIRAF